MELDVRGYYWWWLHTIHHSFNRPPRITAPTLICTSSASPTRSSSAPTWSQERGACSPAWCGICVRRGMHLYTRICHSVTTVRSCRGSARRSCFGKRSKTQTTCACLCACCASAWATRKSTAPTCRLVCCTPCCIPRMRHRGLQATRGCTSAWRRTATMRAFPPSARTSLKR